MLIKKNRIQKFARGRRSSRIQVRQKVSVFSKKTRWRKKKGGRRRNISKNISDFQVYSRTNSKIILGGTPNTIITVVVLPKRNTKKQQ